MFLRLSLNLLLSLLAASCLALPDDQYQAIAIEADSATIDDKNGLTIYQGGVILQQGSLKLQADLLTVKQNPKTREAEQLSAHGKPASFEQIPKVNQDKVEARAETILYFIASQRVELSGNAELKQGDSNISSDKISYLSAEQLFQAKPDETQGEKKRVQVVIPAPKQKADVDKEAKQ